MITRQDALGFRVTHTSELIGMFQGYIQEMPEYDQSVIQHLDVIRDQYLMECGDVPH